MNGIRPGSRPWRITALHLDDQERLSSFVVEVHAALVHRVQDLIDDDVTLDVLGVVPSLSLTTPAIYRLSLPVARARTLLYAAGNLPEGDPRRVPGLYDSLARFTAMIEQS